VCSRAKFGTKGRTGACRGPTSVEQIEDFCNPNPIQNFHWVIRSDPSPVDLLKYLIQSCFYLKKILIKHLAAVINAIWISNSDPVWVFSKSSPIRIPFWIAPSGWIAIRKLNHVQHWGPLASSQKKTCEWL